LKVYICFIKRRHFYSDGDTRTKLPIIPANCDTQKVSADLKQKKMCPEIKGRREFNEVAIFEK
jgi:hypothetical protein